MLKNRPVQEQVLITLSLTIAIVLVPFGLYRIIQADWIIGIFDITASVLLISLSLNVYANRHVEFARKAMSVFVFAAVLLSVYLKGKAQNVWLYPAIPLIFYLTTPFIAARVTLIAIAVMTLLMYDQMTRFELMTMIFTYLTTGACSFAFGYQWLRHQQELVNQAITDPLTKVKNRRAFDEYFDKLIADKQDECKNHVLVIFDIDNFKAINDKHGHKVGDKVLIHITKLVSERLRKSDGLYRIGGEEFLIILHNTSVEDAESFTNNLCQLIASNSILKNESVTISAGLAKSPKTGHSGNSWFKRADAALYQAKANGRNCVETAND
ncbi:GGDEF domain-containing protein [Colwellia sp. MEBiC06753]